MSARTVGWGHRLPVAQFEQARRLGAAATRAARQGVVSSVISQHRFDPASVLVAESIAAGRFGRLTSAVASVAWWRSDEYYASAGWRGTWAYPGDHTRISVHGTAGGAEIENNLLRRCTVDGSPDLVTVAEAPPGGHVAQYDDILQTIGAGGRPAVTVQDAIEALATVRSIYVAATLQRPVSFLDVLEGRYDDVDVSRGVGLPLC